MFEGDRPLRCQPPAFMVECKKPIPIESKVLRNCNILLRRILQPSGH
jgi:hypothetical protein